MDVVSAFFSMNDVAPTSWKKKQMQSNDGDVLKQYMDDTSVKYRDILNEYREDSDESSVHSVADYEEDLQAVMELEKEMAHVTLKDYETHLVDKENSYMQCYHQLKEQERAYMRSKHRLCHLQSINTELLEGWKHSHAFTPEEYQSIVKHLDDMDQKINLFIETQRLRLQSLQNKLRECTLTEQENDTLFRITELRREYFNAL